MNPELHAFFLDPSASGHLMHAELSEAYQRACEQAGAQHELIAYTDEFGFLLDEVQDLLRDENEYPEYTSQLADFRTALTAIDARRAQVADLHIEIRQSLEEFEGLRTARGESLRTADDPDYESWLNARDRTLAEVERLRADPDMTPHVDRVLTNLPALANAATPTALAQAAAPSRSSDPGEAETALPAANAASRPEAAAPSIAATTETPMLSWAGIGSRGNDKEPMPPSVLADMKELARRMAADGWHLSSGGADGSDTAFASGTPVDQRTIWLPWPGYNDLSGPDCHPIPQDRLRQSLELAERFHPNWQRCKPGMRKLHARNGLIVLGRNLDKPVDAVVAYTQGGKLQGGTAQGLRIAIEHGIPIFNLGRMTMEEAWKGLQELRRSLTAGQGVSAGKDRTEPDAHRAATDASNTHEAGRKEGMARVLHLRNAPPDAIRIDRRTRWGNPFRIGPDGTREDVISKYRDHLWNSIRTGEISKDDLAELHGKNLACHCAPQPCHGDVLASAAAWANANRNRASTAESAEALPTSPRIVTRREFLETAGNASAAAHDNKAVARATAAETIDAKLPASLGLVTNHRRLLEAAQDGWLRPLEGKSFLLARDGSVSEDLAAGDHPIPVRLTFDPGKFPFPALRRELAAAGAEADAATPLAWRSPIPLSAITGMEVASEEQKTRLPAMAAQFGNVTLPAVEIAVNPDLATAGAGRPASTSDIPALQLPERLNAIQGALSMAAATLPKDERWTEVLRNVLNAHPSRPISDPANSNADWFSLPWIPRSAGMPAQPSANDQRRLWDAAMSCLRWPAAEGKSPAALAERIAATASETGPNPAADRWLEQTQKIISAEESINPTVPFIERAGVAIQLALLRPDPNRFTSWNTALPELPDSVLWAGATLCGWRRGYLELDNAFRGDTAQRETVANAALAATVPSAYAPTWHTPQQDAGAIPDTWQRIKIGYASLYRAAGDQFQHLPHQEGFCEFRDFVAAAVADPGCPQEHQARLTALHNTLEIQARRHDAVHDAHTRLNDVGARLEDLKEKMSSEPGQTIETMPGYTGWLRDRDAAVAHWSKLAEDPAHKEHMQILAPDMMAPQIAELTNAPLTSIHRPSAEYPVPSSGQGVYTPSLQPLSQVYDRALAFVDRDPALLPYAPQFDELKTAVTKALDECRHAPDLLDRLTNMRTALDDSHKRMTRAQAATKDIADASQALCTMKAWADRAGRPVQEAPQFESWRSEADHALHEYEAAKKDPALAPHLARADSMGVLSETAVPMLRDTRFQAPVASKSSLTADRRRSEETEEQYSMSA